MKKRGFEFSFAWLFAVLVGAVILFLAIYAASKIISTGEYKTDTMTAKQLSIIFEPLETGLASGKSNIAILNDETRIYNYCNSAGSFGLQRFSLSSESFGKWTEQSADIPVNNKYIFSKQIEQGKQVYLLSNSFEFPWKISEVISLTTDSYCFVNAPDNIKNEISFLAKNVNVDNCSKQDIKVCFGSGSECDIKVIGNCLDYTCESQFDYGYVQKQDKLFYISELLYPAIFSNKEIYECNVKRLMKRMIQQALIFKQQSNLISTKCKGLPTSGLIHLTHLARNLQSSKDLLIIKQTANEVDEQNSASQCQLW